MLTASGLTMSFGTRVLFRDVTITLAPGRRVALVGGNGCGKTTLLEILMGRHDADSGSITRPSDLTIAYLPQEASETPAGTVLDEVRRGAPGLIEAAAEMRRLEAQLAEAEGAEQERLAHTYAEAHERFEHHGGYSIDAEAHRLLVGLGFAPTDADRPLAEMSGGWRMRAALARILLGDPDVVVLDEPTNHLDVDSVAWLEQELLRRRGGLLFVSHDRDFIDNVATHVIELAGGRATEYVGGFAEFVAEREERLAGIQAAATQQEREIARTEQFIERFRYKASKARQVQSRIRALERLDRIELPDLRTVRARFAFPEPPRGSRIVAELEDVAAGYDGQRVLDRVNLVLERGQRVALLGPNGAGKSTLVKVLIGELAALSGSVRLGHRTVVAAFAQHQAEILDDRRTVIDEFKTAVPDAPGRNPRTLLGSFGFPGDAAERRVADLSGGERARLALGKIMCEPANLLVLDEPTNHLDLPSCDLLEDALRAYPGTVLLVTHDRYLIRSVATDLVEVRDGRAVAHHGVDEELLLPPALRPGSTRSTSPSPTPSPPDRPGRDGSRPRRADQRRDDAERRNRTHQATKDARRLVVSAERRWERAEREVADTQALLADPGIYDDPERVRTLVAQHDAAKDAAASAMASWEEATLRLEAILRDLDDAST